MGDDTIKKSVTIDAPVETVWAAITTPEVIKEWFFGVDTETDWQVGSPIVHKGSYQGKPYMDKGEITEFDPPHVFAHTHWSDMSGKPDKPENYEHVTWQLAERDGGTQLTLQEKNLPSEEAKKLSEKSWDAVLQQLKKTLENKPVDEHAPIGR